LLLNGLSRLKDAIIQEEVYHLDYIPLNVTAKSNALQVPQEAVLNRLTRYENHLLRHLYRAQHELERMKRIRLGDKVAPPSASTN
jgi:hypothetical protein